MNLQHTMSYLRAEIASLEAENKERRAYFKGYEKRHQHHYDQRAAKIAQMKGELKLLEEMING